MNGRYLAVAFASAVVASTATSTLRSARATPAGADLLDPKHPSVGANAEWRRNVREFCDGAQAIINAQDRLHAAADVSSVKSTGPGKWSLAMATSGGTISLDLTLPVAPDAGAP